MNEPRPYNGSSGMALLRESAVLILLLWAFAQAMFLAFSSAESRTVYLVFILIMDAAVLIGYLNRPVLCVVACATAVCVWVAYKAYIWYESGVDIVLTDYLMIPMPLIGMASALMFRKGMRALVQENILLKRNVEELVLIDESTGLYNLRALYKDLNVTVKYATRNSLPVTLMIIRMRYAAELESMLSARRYQELKKKLGDIVSGTVRVEDRVYCIDETGSLAIILTTDEEGSGIVEARIRNSVAKEGTFDGIADREMRVDLRIAVKQYDEKYGNDMMAFKHDTESELAYDV